MARLAGQDLPIVARFGGSVGLLSIDGADVARFDGLVDYTRYAVRLRYEAADPGGGQLDRSEAIERVEALLAEVRCRLAGTERG